MAGLPGCGERSVSLQASDCLRLLSCSSSQGALVHSTMSLWHWLIVSGRVTLDSQREAHHRRADPIGQLCLFTIYCCGWSLEQMLLGWQLCSHSFPGGLLHGSPLNGTPGVLPAMHLIHSFKVPSTWEEVACVSRWREVHLVVKLLSLIHYFCEFLRGHASPGV